MRVRLLCLLLAIPSAAATTCDQLATLTLPATTIASATAVAAGQFSPPSGRADAFRNLPAFCRVEATLRPSSDSDIKIEVWLPAAGWNGKYLAVGNGGWSGSINYASMAQGLARGYATSSTDTGHTGGSAAFALGHPEKLIDYAYRSEHEMTVKSKAVIAAFYGDGPKLAYWNGCSAGGKQALKEAQRYPADFDGIVAGAPGLDWVGRAALSLWVAQATRRSDAKDDASAIPASKFAAIHDAALAVCDVQDGAKDGVIENPALCRFDPATLLCKAGDSATCLTKAQVETARRIYAGPGAAVSPGLSPGSEMGWSTFAGPQPFGIGLDYFRYVVFEDPQWDFRKLNFDADIARARKLDGERINAADPDLSAFLARGGKLIQYHGWADPQIPPQASVIYFKSVQDKMGAEKVAGFYRLFMVPGMAHCGGGDGTSTFDMLTALEQWVEQKQAPERIPASRVRDGKADRTRPLCPYPQTARYNGKGSIAASMDDASNFTCRP